MYDQAIQYRIEFIHGKRKPEVDECDQGWLRCRLDPCIDTTNLLQMVNEMFAMAQESDGAFTYRVVQLDECGEVRLVA